MTKGNGRWTAGVLVAIFLAAASLIGLGFRANDEEHTAMANGLASAKLKCTEERSADRQRIARVESAIITTAQELERIRKAIERLER